MDLGCLDLGCISVDKHSTETVVHSQNKDGDATEPTSSSSSSSSKSAKNKSLRESQSTLNALNKFTSQIKKPPHRKISPLNWFPRKKVDSYLKRKIKMLQEVDGMNLTLDETLGDSNPHYSRVLREKIAAREAAHKAMEARKASLVEASWCRILRAARIQSKEAEALLLKAEKTAAEAFEVATAAGVIMYDKPNGSQKTCQVETSSVNGGGSTTHTVTASFETAFEVDKEVAAAVKTAFIRLVNCPSFSKDEFKDLLRKISQNPDTGDNNQELSEFSSECESESGSELDTMSHSQDLDFKVSVVEMTQRKNKRRQSLEKLTMEKLIDMMVERLRCLQEDELSSLATIVATCGLNAALAEVENNKMHDPGSAADYPSVPALRRMSSFGSGTMRNSNLEYFLDGQIRRKQPESELPSLDQFLVKHMTKLEREVQEAKNSRRYESKEGTVDNADKTDDGKLNSESNITSSETLQDLGSILVKHSLRLVREIEEAKKNSGNNFGTELKSTVTDISSSEAVPDLGSVLIKHSSRLEKEIEETKRYCGKTFEMNGTKMGRLPSRVVSHTKEEVQEVPSLDKFLVKHVSRLEKEVQEARNSRKNDLLDGRRVTNLKKKVDSTTLDSQFNRNESFSSNGGTVEKENINLNSEVDQNSEMEKKECAMNLPPSNTAGCTGGETVSLQDTRAGTVVEDSLDKILVKPVHRLEREKMQALSLGSNYGNHRPQKKQGGNNVTDCESLDKVLVKHVSRLEKEKMRFNASEVVKGKTSNTSMHYQMNEEGSLDQILVKHKSRLEREKMAAAQQPGDQIRFSIARREARERELQETWGGLSLGNSIRPHFSKLERDKAAWIKAEEEERSRAMREV